MSGTRRDRAALALYDGSPSLADVVTAQGNSLRQSQKAFQRQLGQEPQIGGSAFQKGFNLGWRTHPQPDVVDATRFDGSKGS